MLHNDAIRRRQRDPGATGAWRLQGLQELQHLIDPRGRDGAFRFFFQLL